MKNTNEVNVNTWPAGEIKRNANGTQFEVIGYNGDEINFTNQGGSVNLGHGNYILLI